MNRTDRLLAIVLELQAKGRARAQDLADGFETSKRTIYRDIEALCEAGVPIVAVPGRGYSLVEGYFLPPLSFSATEATALLLGGDFVAQNFDRQYREAAEAAARKIEAVLPAPRRAELRELRDSLHIITPDALDEGAPEVADRLRRLRGAILDRRTVRFRYHARHGQGGDEERTADPYSLTHIAGVWYLIARSHERDGIRSFRLGRMEGVVVGAEGFVRPPGFRPRDPGRGPDDRAVTVRALFDAGAARRLSEARSFYQVEQEETTGSILVTFRVRQEADLLPWLLGWGREVRVIEPASLRRRLADEAAAILRIHRDPAALLT